MSAYSSSEEAEAVEEGQRQTYAAEVWDAMPV